MNHEQCRPTGKCLYCREMTFNQSAICFRLECYEKAEAAQNPQHGRKTKTRRRNK